MVFDNPDKKKYPIFRDIFLVKTRMSVFFCLFVLMMLFRLPRQAVLALIRHFGAFACVTVTSSRKAVSIALSFVLFAKPFTLRYLYSGLLVLAGTTKSVTPEINTLDAGVPASVLA